MPVIFSDADRNVGAAAQHRQCQEDLPIPLNASVSEGDHIVEHNILNADPFDDLDVIPDTGPINSQQPCDTVVGGACNGTPPLQSNEEGPVKVLQCSTAVNESTGEPCKTAMKKRGQDKENATPPLAAPGRRSRVSTGKRARGSDVPRYPLFYKPLCLMTTCLQ